MAEARAITQRRSVASVDDYDGDDAIAPALAGQRLPAVRQPADASESALPRDTIGLALSGGGIRSATFCLGVLQSLAQLRRLREVDFLSTVSGGGFIGAFLGRLFQRDFALSQANPMIAVEQVLRNSASGPLRWLRSQADYINAAGPTDGRQNFAVYLRNLLTIHVILALFGLAVFGLIRGAGDVALHWLSLETHSVSPWLLSPWWAAAVLVFLVAVVPTGLGFWTAPRPRCSESFSPGPLAVMLVLLAVCTYSLTVPAWRTGSPGRCYGTSGPR
jgi:hypothetical protein